MRAERRDRSIAGTSTVAIHLLAIGLLFNQASNGRDDSPGNGQSSGDRMVVYPMLQVSPETRMQRLSAPVATFNAEEPSVAESGTPVGEQVLPATETNDGSQPAYQSAGDTDLAAPERNLLWPSTTTGDATLSATPSAGSTGENTLFASYQSALRTAIFRTWKTLSPRSYPTGCTIHLTQNPGGAVTATSAAACGLTREEQLQLEAAALRAQPMPYAGYETVFVREMDLVL